jgi:hypothetical protein
VGVIWVSRAKYCPTGFASVSARFIAFRLSCFAASSSRSTFRRRLPHPDVKQFKK